MSQLNRNTTISQASTASDQGSEVDIIDNHIAAIDLNRSLPALPPASHSPTPSTTAATEPVITVPAPAAAPEWQGVFRGGPRFPPDYVTREYGQWGPLHAYRNRPRAAPVQNTDVERDAAAAAAAAIPGSFRSFFAWHNSVVVIGVAFFVIIFVVGIALPLALNKGSDSADNTK